MFFSAPHPPLPTLSPYHWATYHPTIPPLSKMKNRTPTPNTKLRRTASASTSTTYSTTPQEPCPTRTHARPGAAGGALWPMRTTAGASGIKAPWTGCGSRTLPTCAAPKAGSTCAPCVMRTRAESWDTPWASSTTRALVITALDMAATTRGGFPTGVVLHADRGTQFTTEKLAA